MTSVKKYLMSTEWLSVRYLYIVMKLKFWADSVHLHEHLHVNYKQYFGIVSVFVCFLFEYRSMWIDVTWFWNEWAVTIIVTHLLLILFTETNIYFEDYCLMSSCWRLIFSLLLKKMWSSEHGNGFDHLQKRNRKTAWKSFPKWRNFRLFFSFALNFSSLFTLVPIHEFWMNPIN